MARRTDIEKLQRDIEQAIHVLERNIKVKPARLEADIKDNALSVISAWYAQYDPHKYRRSMSLKKAFKITRDGIDVSIDYDPSYLNDYNHHQDNDIIFNNAFVSGYHGGSMGTDKNGMSVSTPHWRKPFLSYRRWGNEAPKSFSPQERIEKKSNKLIKEYEEEWIKLLYDDILAPIRKDINRL